ncbi:MAG: hypothetical protein EBZ05_02480 [Verrucomicrobia bacterium]|nr:hypothetical protein [Verrucomicrobiota bacterium]
MTTSPETLLEALRWRYATKSFDAGRSIPDDLWQTLEDTLVLTPSSYGLQPWRFLVIRDAALKAELRPHSWNQSQITDASHLVVLLSRRRIEGRDLDRLIEATADCRGLDPATLAGRLHASSDRPLLSGDSREAALAQQLAQRADFYEESEIQIDVSRLGPEEAIAAIRNQLPAPWSR